MANKPGETNKRTILLTKAKQKRVIAVYSREAASQIANDADKRDFIARAEQLEREAAMLEGEAAKLPNDPY